jgi:hypothetical protein
LCRGFQLNGAGLLIAAREYQTDQGNRRCQPMLFHPVSLFMRQKGKRVKPRAYQAAAINGYRHERGKRQISSGNQRFSCSIEKTVQFWFRPLSEKSISGAGIVRRR